MTNTEFILANDEKKPFPVVLAHPGNVLTLKRHFILFQEPDLLEGTWGDLPSSRTKELPCNLRPSWLLIVLPQMLLSVLRPGRDLTRICFCSGCWGHVTVLSS